MTTRVIIGSEAALGYVIDQLDEMQQRLISIQQKQEQGMALSEQTNAALGRLSASIDSFKATTQQLLGTYTDQIRTLEATIESMKTSDMAEDAEYQAKIDDLQRLLDEMKATQAANESELVGKLDAMGASLQQVQQS